MNFCISTRRRCSLIIGSNFACNSTRPRKFPLLGSLILSTDPLKVKLRTDKNCTIATVFEKFDSNIWSENKASHGESCQCLLFLLSRAPASQQLVTASKCACNFFCILLTLWYSLATGQILHLQRSCFVFPVGDSMNNRPCLPKQNISAKDAKYFHHRSAFICNPLWRMPTILIFQKIVQSNHR